MQREKAWPRPSWACSSTLFCNSGTNFVRCCVAPLKKKKAGRACQNIKTGFRATHSRRRRGHAEEGMQ